MYCTACGNQINNESLFCKSCGFKLEKNIPVMGNETQVTYGSFLPRSCAFVIDFLIILISSVIIYLIFNFAEGSFWDNYILWIVFFLYHSFCINKFGTTIGKSIFGLKVIDARKGKKLNYFRSLVRSLCYYLSTWFFFLGFLNVWFDKKKHQGWHDKIVNSEVIQVPFKTRNAYISIVISLFLYLLLILFYVNSPEGQNQEEKFRSGTRKIQNDLNINSKLFQENEKEANTPNIFEKSISGPSFDVNKELSAVVEITCPDDNNNRNVYGSGTVILDSGVIITNQHVIKDANKYLCEVAFTNSLSETPLFMYYAAIMVDDSVDPPVNLTNAELDVGLLKIVDSFDGYTLPDKFPTITSIGSSDALNINETVYVAGYPSFGAGTITFTNGIVSGRAGDDYIKTSAKVDFGNSGGAAFNEKGEFIGIPSLLYEGGTEGLGYILGIDSVLEWLRTNEYL